MGNARPAGRVFPAVMGKKRHTGRLTSKVPHHAGTEPDALYDLSTPLWDRYYRRVRRSIKFPRYYRKRENW